MPNIEIEKLINSFSESVKLVQKVKAQMDEIQGQISPQIKNVQSMSQKLLNAIGTNAEEVFKKLDEREEQVDEKYKDALDEIEQKKKKVLDEIEQKKENQGPLPPEPEELIVGKVDGCSYRVVDGKVEVRFSRVLPSTRVKEVLKKHRFGWSKTKVAWIGNADRHPENVKLAKELAGEI